jgi:hypothetical protein
MATDPTNQQAWTRSCPIKIDSFCIPFVSNQGFLKAFERTFNGLEILSSSIFVPPYVVSLFDEDVDLFRDFFKLRFHIIP